MDVQALNNRIHFFLTAILAFLIPVYSKLIPFTIVLLVANWIWYLPNISKSFSALKVNYALTAMMLMYLLNVIFLINTDNFHFAGEELETKLSFLILPLIYAARQDESREHLYFYLKLFVYGCLVYASICFGYALYAFLKPVYTVINGSYFNFGTSYFYYTNLSRLFHPSYAAVHTVIGIYTIYYLSKKEFIRLDLKWKFLLSFLILFVLMLSSKAGWVSLAIVLLLIVYDLFIRKNYFFALLLFFLALCGFLFLNVYKAPEYAQRIPQMETIENSIKEKDNANRKLSTGSDGTARRIFVWKASLEVFGEHFFTGVGTGDPKDVLMEKYTELNMHNEFANRLNSHNQFFTYMIAFGIAGLIVFLICLFFPIRLSMQTGESILLVFALVVAINCLFESLFERQDGVIVYAFLQSVLCASFWNKHKTA